MVYLSPGPNLACVYEDLLLMMMGVMKVYITTTDGKPATSQIQPGKYKVSMAEMDSP